MRRHRSALLTGAAAVALLAGCGGTSGAASTSAQAAASDRGMVQFARCMRARGVNMPDPYHRPGHAGLSIELPRQGPATSQAYAACGRFLQATIDLKERAAGRRITPAVRLGLIHYAECMRSHAIPMLDPTPLGALALGNVPGISSGLGRYTPQFHAADHACRRLLPATISDDGTGP